MGYLRFVVLFCRNNQHQNTEKGTFSCITFLIFLNSNQGVPTDPKRIKVNPEWPTPPSIRKIWGSHDLRNFYKRFVPYFSILVAPSLSCRGTMFPHGKMSMKGVFRPYSTVTYPTPLRHMIFFQVTREGAQSMKNLGI